MKALWDLSADIEGEAKPWIQIRKQKAEFIMPNRVQEIFSGKPGASIDDALIK